MKTHLKIFVRVALLLPVLALNLSVTQQIKASFTPTGSLLGVRAYHTATLLPNSTVLVAGGYNGTNRLITTQVYDPATARWTASGPLAAARLGHTATLLFNGLVLVTGGHVSATSSTSTCEVYNSIAKTWTTTGAMTTARGWHTATLLANGKVLVAGGYNRNGGYAVSTAELYDPATGAWTPTGSLSIARDTHTGTLLPSGKVLVAGGSPDQGNTSLLGAELYDPTTGVWAATGWMISAREFHRAALLPDGRVLVAGGDNGTSGISGAELYDPASGIWRAVAALASARTVHTATLLPDGKILIAAGLNGIAYPQISLSSAELYDPATETWTAATGALSPERFQHTATLLPNGKVLLAGGRDLHNPDTDVFLSSAELYDSAAGPISLVNPVTLPGGAFRFAFTGAANATNTVLATTNPALSLANWTVLGLVPEFSPGLYLFSDPQAANHPQRFYSVRSP